MPVRRANALARRFTFVFAARAAATGKSFLAIKLQTLFAGKRIAVVVFAVALFGGLFRAGLATFIVRAGNIVGAKIRAGVFAALTFPYAIRGANDKLRTAYAAINFIDLSRGAFALV